MPPTLEQLNGLTLAEFRRKMQRVGASPREWYMGLVTDDDLAGLPPEILANTSKTVDINGVTITAAAVAAGTVAFTADGKGILTKDGTIAIGKPSGVTPASPIV